MGDVLTCRARASNAETAPTIDVIVVTRTRDLVLECLDHLRRQTVAHRVFLADNGGNVDGTSDAVRNRFEDVQVVTFDRNRGFAHAVNHLARLGSGDIIMLVNDDMNVDPAFVEHLVEPFSDPRVGMCAGLSLQPPNGQFVDGFGIEVDCTLVAFNRLRHRSLRDPAGVLLGPSGGAAAYRRVAWESAAGFDPKLFFYCEDLDLALRLRLAGWEAAAADARGVHLGGASSGTDTPFQRAHAGFGRGFILRRYGVLRTRHALRALLIEALTIAKGITTTHTLLPLRARVAGWRAAGRGPRLLMPDEGIDESISLRVTLHRLRFER